MEKSKFKDFKGLENGPIKFQDLPGFPGPIQNLYVMGDFSAEECQYNSLSAVLKVTRGQQTHYREGKEKALATHFPLDQRHC